MHASMMCGSTALKTAVGGFLRVVRWEADPQKVLRAFVG
jgi:hypothetical protein